MKKELIVKVVIFMGLTFLFTIVLAIVQETLKIDYSLVVLPQFGPGIAAIVMVLLIFKHKFIINFKLKSLKAKDFLWCIFLPIILIAFGYLLKSSFYGFHPIFSSNDTQILVITMFGILLGAFGEALGWRSFLQRFLDEKLGLQKAGIITGVLWGLWHVGHYSNGIFFMLTFLIFTISFSLILGILNRKAYYNLYLATIFHFSANIGFFVFYKDHSSDIKMMLFNALVWLIIALGLLFILQQKGNHHNTHDIEATD